MNAPSARSMRLSLVVCGLGAWLGACAALPETARTAIGDYDGNTLLCRNESTRAVCHLWLYADGRYFVFYDRGPQQVMPAAGGNFRIEGRRGRYRLLPAASGFEVCLSPEPVPGKEFQIEKSGELFAGSACYELQRRSAGESWTQTTGNGQTYRMWLVRGRG